jgi:hypothetical protein
MRFHYYFFLLIFFSTPLFSFAATGIIDPDNQGHFKATVLRDGSLINTGRYSDNPTNEDAEVTVTNTELTGYFWAAKYGWINLNCENNNSCSSGNNYFRVENDDGELSGYAWGQKTGWINFSPPSGGVTIASNGNFSGLAWGQKMGWIQFDCGQADGCTETDWESSGTTTTGGSAPAVCSDGDDNDGDGFIDMDDLGCSSGIDDDETNTIPEDPTIYACSDLIDNDEDGFTDLSEDSGCSAWNDNSEYNNIPQDDDCESTNTCPTYIPTCQELGTCSTDTGCTGDDCLVSPPIETCTDGDCTPQSQTDPIDFGEISNTNPGQTTNLIQGFFDNLNFSSIGISELFGSMGIPNLTEGVQIGRIIGLIGMIAALLSIPTSFWRSLFAFLWRRKSHGWGVVYDSITKQPLDPAYVVLKDMLGNEVTTAITDMDGRYGFLVSPGKYTIVANKTHYEFPSKRLAGKERDELYQNLYFGGPIEVTEKNEVVLANIPMDPLGFDWNEFAKREKKLMNYYSPRELLLVRISNALFAFGFTLSVVLLVLRPDWINALIVALYILIYFVKRSIFRGKVYGGVVDMNTGAGLPFAIIRVYFAELKREVLHKVTDEMGRYYCLIQKGSYYVTIEKKNTDGTYTLVHTSEPFVVKNGMINTTFHV